VQIEANLQGGSWGAFQNPHEELVAQLTEASEKGQKSLQKLESKFGRSMARFQEAQSEARHLNLRFLIDQVSFSDYEAGVALVQSIEIS
jgi:hypothetical protein